MPGTANEKYLRLNVYTRLTLAMSATWSERGRKVASGLTRGFAAALDTGRTPDESQLGNRRRKMAV